jgi:hypothetical protein
MRPIRPNPHPIGVVPRASDDDTAGLWGVLPIRPPSYPVRVIHRDQLAVGQRSHEIVFIAGGIIYNVAGQSAAIPLRIDQMPTPPPDTAIAAIINVTGMANTLSGNAVTYLFYPNPAGGGTADSAIGAVSLPMVNASYSVRQQLLVPLVNRGICWEALAGAAVRMDTSIRLGGYVLA